ncbi:MAG: AAA family ATPase [Deltaproteobacteria bacterium]|nr:AAA family ATPase [Deltaproteobacteria bacterium]
MSRGSTLNVMAMTRSPELGERITPLLAAIDHVRAETRIGDLHSVNGELAAALEGVDVLLVDLDANDERELGHLGEIIEQRRGRTAILATARDLSAQGVRSLIRQGVDDFIPQPFELPDMEDAIATARAKLQQARAGRNAGQVISVTRAKGGMGASTLAAHLALALHEKRHRREPEKQVALLDLDLQFGDLSLMLDLKPSAEMAEIIRDPARLDGALLRASMTQHKSGLAVLPAPGEFVPLDALPAAATVKLIELARQEFDFVVIDLPLAAPRWLEAVLQQTEQLLLVSQLNVAAIRQTRRLLDFFRDEAHYELPVSVVLNRYVWRLSERGRLRQAIRALGQPIDHFVPDDPRLALEAINRGTPLFELRRRAKLCRALRGVAAASLKVVQERAQPAGPSAQAA